MTSTVTNAPQKKWYQHTWLYVVGGILLFIFLILGWFAKSYNNMSYSQQNVEQQEGQVQTVLQRRGDLIPQLMGAVKGQQKQEKGVYGMIAKARTQYYNASNRYSNSHDPAQKAQALNQQDGAFNAMIGGIKENYPQLASSRQMSDFQSQIEGSENRINVQRIYLNRDIQDYNSYLVGFPTNMVANMTNHHPVPYFKGDAKAQKAPKVQF